MVRATSSLTLAELAALAAFCTRADRWDETSQRGRACGKRTGSGLMIVDCAFETRIASPGVISCQHAGGMRTTTGGMEGRTRPASVNESTAAWRSANSTKPYSPSDLAASTTPTCGRAP
jgi:hypothetical protein